jgi:hypothetical protein
MRICYIRKNYLFRDILPYILFMWCCHLTRLTYRPSDNYSHCHPPSNNTHTTSSFLSLSIITQQHKSHDSHKPPGMNELKSLSDCVNRLVEGQTVAK